MNPMRHILLFLLAGWTATSPFAAEPLNGCTDMGASGLVGAQEASPYWWHRFPVYVGDIGEIGPEQVARLHARMVSGNYAADPAWGPYAQRVNGNDAAGSFHDVKKTGARWISWVETFGDCMLYAGAFRKKADGSYEAYPDDAALPKLVRTAWSWEFGGTQPDDVLCWVGLHNCVNNEEFLPPSLRREQLGLPVPCYPDGREALGWIPDGQYPVNARMRTFWKTADRKTCGAVIWEWAQ